MEKSSRAEAKSTAFPSGVKPLTKSADELGELARNTEKLLKAVAEYTGYLQKLAGRLSHELKTPTAGILLLAESADQAARDGDDAQALAFLSQIQAEAARLRQLVGDLLDLSRLESTPSAGTVTDVRRSIELALAGHGRAAKAKGLKHIVVISSIGAGNSKNAVSCMYKWPMMSVRNWDNRLAQYLDEQQGE